MCVCGCQSDGHNVCVSLSEQVCVWDVTQPRAAQHSSLFKGLFVLLQLVQLLRTDKQDFELRAAKHRPPTPSLKPLWPGPAQHCGPEMDKQTPTHRQTARHERRRFVLNGKFKSSSEGAFLHVSCFFYSLQKERKKTNGMRHLNFT